jgi:FkbM family methyltransferase
MLKDAKEYVRKSFPRPTRWYREAKDRVRSTLFRNSIVEHNYGGHQFKVHINDPVARAWYDLDWPRLPEMEALSQHGLHDGALVFDLGAHQNIVAMMLAKEVMPSGKVVAVEGAKHNAAVGAANAALNGFVNLTTIHAVVGSTEGTTGFTQSYNGEVTANAGGSLQSVTIDSLARQFGKPDVVFMDIEGYEVTALDGATDTLAGNTTWLVEVHGDATLSKYGARNRDVVDRFRHRFSLQAQINEDGIFRAFSDAAIPESRFWLIAVPNQGA